MSNIELLTKKTNELAAKMGIADQIENMTTPEKLANMANRFALIKHAAAQKMCLDMQAMFNRLA